MLFRSVIETTRREPSLNRDACTRMLTALDICCRIDVNCMFEFASETISKDRLLEAA